MSEGRCGFLAGLLVGLVPAAAVARAARDEDPLLRAQYYGGPPRGWRRRRRKRCWIERRQVVVRDAFGRPRRRIVEREVCR